MLLCLDSCKIDGVETGINRVKETLNVYYYSVGSKRFPVPSSCELEDALHPRIKKSRCPADGLS